jgi:hypothetical protein
MSNIYKETLGRVAKGARFSVNLEHRSLRVNGKYVIKDGNYEGNLGCAPSDEPLREIERLYERFYYSVPSQRSEQKVRSYFRALPEKELPDEDMLYGMRREEAQAELELFVLCQLIQNALDWNSFASGLWFWQSSKYPSLIILKKWIDPNKDTQINNNK